MRSIRVSTLALFAASALLAAPAFADPSQTDREAAAEQAQARLADIKAQLNITADQEAQFEAIMKDSAEKRGAVMEKYGLNEGKRPGPRQLRGLRSEMGDIQESTRAQLSTVLTTEQMAQFETIQAEQQEEMRARLQERRG